MRHSDVGGFAHGRPVRAVAAALLFLLFCLAASPGTAAEFNLSSRTYGLYFQREAAAGGDRTFAPVYEYLSGDATGLGDVPVSFHFYAWGRLDLADKSDDDGRGGDVGSAYMQYLHPTGNAEIRLGRFFLAEGVARDIVDGAFVKVRTALGVGVSLFGGLPVERSANGIDTGDSIFGGRLFAAAPGFVEIGVSYLNEKGNFQGDDRQVAGGDFWIRPALPLELSGRASYNIATEGMADQRYLVRIFPLKGLDLSAGYETYAYKDLFQTALNNAFLAPAVDNGDEVRSTFVVVDYRPLDWLVLTLAAKTLDHDRDDPGDANRGEASVRFIYNGKKDAAGISAAVVDADRAENGYKEFRAFATYSPGIFRFALDGLTHRYDEPILGSDVAYHAVGSAGMQLLPSLRISGDLTYNRSPRFQDDYAGLVRVALDLGASSGGKK